MWHPSYNAPCYLCFIKGSVSLHDLLDLICCFNSGAWSRVRNLSRRTSLCLRNEKLKHAELSFTSPFQMLFDVQLHKIPVKKIRIVSKGYICAYMCACMYLFVRDCARFYLCVQYCVCAYVCAYSGVCVCVYVRMYVWACASLRLCVCLRACT